MDYSYSYDYTYTDPAAGELVGLIGVISVIAWIISLICLVLNIIGMWKAFKKAGKPGWAAIVPIYNIIVMLEISELPMWYIALFFVPFVNIYAVFKVYIEFAHKYGKSTGFGVLTVFFAPICFMILGCGNCEYVGNQDYNSDYQNQNMNYNNQMPVMNDMQMSQNNNMNMNNQIPNMNDMQMSQNNNMNNQVNPNQPIIDNNQSFGFCSNCGSKLTSDVAFCPNCGNRLK